MIEIHIHHEPFVAKKLTYEKLELMISNLVEKYFHKDWNCIVCSTTTSEYSKNNKMKYHKFYVEKFEELKSLLPIKNSTQVISLYNAEYNMAEFTFGFSLVLTKAGFQLAGCSSQSIHNAQQIVLEMQSYV